MIDIVMSKRFFKGVKENQFSMVKVPQSSPKLGWHKAEAAKSQDTFERELAAMQAGCPSKRASGIGAPKHQSVSPFCYKQTLRWEAQVFNRKMCYCRSDRFCLSALQGCVQWSLNTFLLSPCYGQSICGHRLYVTWSSFPQHPFSPQLFSALLNAYRLFSSLFSSTLWLPFSTWVWSGFIRNSESRNFVWLKCTDFGSCIVGNMPWTLRYAKTTCALAQIIKSDEQVQEEFAFPADAEANVDMDGAMSPASIQAMGVGFVERWRWLGDLGHFERRNHCMNETITLNSWQTLYRCGARRRWGRFFSCKKVQMNADDVFHVVYQVTHTWKAFADHAYDDTGSHEPCCIIGKLPRCFTTWNIGIPSGNQTWQWKIPYGNQL